MFLPTSSICPEIYKLDQINLFSYKEDQLILCTALLLHLYIFSYECFFYGSTKHRDTWKIYDVKPINCTGMKPTTKYCLANAGQRQKREEAQQLLLGTRPRNEGTVADVGQVTSVTAPARYLVRHSSSPNHAGPAR
jgi:hypothetical protein